ncbi:MAG: hypothetical protein JWL64_2053, partial [Frankiales bacterium]|nr:hypothetical protein [Frankiales bacterium]
ARTLPGVTPTLDPGAEGSAASVRLPDLRSVRVPFPLRPTSPAVLVGGGVLGLAVVTAGATYLVNGADVPRGISVAGVDIGGLSRAAAEARLGTGLAEAGARPIRLDAAGTPLTLDPATAGLAFDAKATLDRATGGPWFRIKGLFGAQRAVPPRSTADDAALKAALTAAAKGFDRPVQEGGIRFEGTTPVPVLPVAGHGVLVDRAADVVADRWLTGGVVTLPVGDTAPVVSAEAVQDAVVSLARPAVAGPVTLTSGDGTLVLTPADIVSGLRFVPGPDGTLVRSFDAAALTAALGSRMAAIQNAPTDATFVINGGVPVVVPSRDGRTVTPESLQKGVLTAIAAPTRTAGLPLVTTPATFTTAAANALGIKEQIGTFTTKHPCCAPRVSNIHRIADLVQGHVVRPGATYSLNGDVGERTAAKGFVAAPQIMNGEFVEGLGGGISQFTTTMYNATFFAGMTDVEHQPHSYYISRYPEGREATITYPRPDLKWKNDSRTGVLITTSYTGTTVTVTLYGTKKYDEVISQSSPRSRVTQSVVTTLPAGPTCKSQKGTIGFDITVTRLMKKGGQVVDTSSDTVRYLPEPTIVCSTVVPPPPPVPVPPVAPVPPPPVEG